jgi:hypothetical protein
MSVNASIVMSFHRQRPRWNLDRQIAGSLPPAGWLIPVLFLALAQACVVRGQEYLQPAQVDQLVAPVALYPDPLVALVLPAAAVPSDIEAAAAFLQQNGDPAQIDYQPWDDSVKALAHYPVVVEWMAQNPGWTGALGTAFLDQPADVMLSIQRLRGEARASGALVSSPQQVVVVDGDRNIEIEPAQTEVIYVPRYDPGVVYGYGAYDFGAGPYITYGDPYPTGIWLTFGFDWRDREVWVGDWSTWHDSHGWRRPVFRNSGPGAGRHWSPPPNRPRPNPPMGGWAAGRAAQPRPIGGTPNSPPRNDVRLPRDDGRAGNPQARGPATAGPGAQAAGPRAEPERAWENPMPPRSPGAAPVHQGPAGHDKQEQPKARPEKKVDSPAPADRKPDGSH